MKKTNKKKQVAVVKLTKMPKEEQLEDHPVFTLLRAWQKVVDGIKDAHRAYKRLRVASEKVVSRAYINADKITVDDIDSVDEVVE